MVGKLTKPICAICGQFPEDPHTEECLRAETELLLSIQEQEQAYQEAREARYEASEREREEWREQRYQQRLAEQEETERIALEWRESQQEPDPDQESWNECLRMMALIGAGHANEIEEN